MKLRSIILISSLSLASLLNGMSNELKQLFAKANGVFSILSYDLNPATIKKAKHQIETSIALVKKGGCEDEDVAMHLVMLSGDLDFVQSLEKWLQNPNNEEKTEELRNLALSSCIYLPIVQKAFKQKGVQF